MKKFQIITVFGFCFYFLMGLNTLSAHEIRPAYLQITQTTDTTYTVLWKVPVLGDLKPKIYPVFPEEFELKTTTTPNKTGGAVVYSYHLIGKTALTNKRLYIHGLNKTLIDVLCTVQYLQGGVVSILLQPDKDEAVFPGEPSLVNTIKSYLLLGVEHILLGYDHLLFVLVLILLIRDKWKIIKTITAFTVAHSITLSAAVIGFISVPSAPVEAVIALSIVFLALELNSKNQGKETLTSKKPWLVAFAFGLLHGLGFAGALKDIGLPEGFIPWALGFFNIGVELGQLFFIGIILLVLPFIRKMTWPKFAYNLPAYTIGSISCFWLIQRLLSFLV